MSWTHGPPLLRLHVDRIRGEIVSNYSLSSKGAETEYVHRWFHSTALMSMQVSNHIKSLESAAGSRDGHDKILNSETSLQSLSSESLAMNCFTSREPERTKKKKG